MPIYSKKPVKIEAIQYTGENGAELKDFVDQPIWECDGSIIIHTLEGCHKASVGDFIIKGVQGEFYSCKSDTFEQTYEQA